MFMLLPACYQLLIGLLISDVLPFISHYLQLDGYSMNAVGIILSVANLMAFVSSLILSKWPQRLRLTYYILSVLSLLFLCVYQYWYGPALTYVKAISICLHFFTFGPLPAILDNYTLNYIKRENYPRYRILSSCGWGLSATLISFLLDYDNVYIICYACYMVLSIIGVYFYKKSAINIDDSIIETVESPKLQIAALMFVSLTYSMGMNVIGYYAIIYLRDVFHANNVILAVRQTVAIILEIPVFYFYPVISSRLDRKTIISIASLLIIFQMTGYLFVNTAPQLLAFELLHGPSYALFWSAVMLTIYNEREHKKIHLIFWSVFSGLGVSLALIMGGYLEMKLLFILLIILNTCSIVTYQLLNIWENKTYSLNLTNH